MQMEAIIFYCAFIQLTMLKLEYSISSALLCVISVYGFLYSQIVQFTHSDKACAILLNLSLSEIIQTEVNGRLNIHGL